MSETHPRPDPRAGAIGGYVPMIDGPEKVTGAAKYTADFLAPATLCGRILRSPRSHAEILEVDVSAARRLPGVVAVITGADCDQPFGVLPIAMNEFPWPGIVCATAASRWRRWRRSTTPPPRWRSA